MTSAFFLTGRQISDIRWQFGTPVYVYDEQMLESQAHAVLQFPNAYGLMARYAMKALPTAAIVRLFVNLGLHIDASSGFEAERAMAAGVPAEKVQITAQELPANLNELLDRGVLFTASSPHQLRVYGGLRPNSDACVRINPGLGSGHNDRTNVGGPSSSFGIWRDHLDQVSAIARECGLRISRMHTHIGSGADPKIWTRCAKISLDIAAQLPEVNTLSLGGGFKVARMPDEHGADLHAIGVRIKGDFEEFAAKTGRRLKLEIEPGTFLVANAGVLVCTAIDVVDTGTDGYRFIKVDSGMTEVARPTLYGAQHPIAAVPEGDQEHEANEMLDYLVVGHCCESGDNLTPKPGNPDGLLPRRLPKTRIGDAIVVGGAGAYCAAMSVKNYNSFPEAPELLLTKDGHLRMIRRRQTLDQITMNELP